MKSWVFVFGFLLVLSFISLASATGPYYFGENTLTGSSLYPEDFINAGNFTNLNSGCFYSHSLTPSCSRPDIGKYATGCSKKSLCSLNANHAMWVSSGNSKGYIDSDFYGSCDSWAPWDMQAGAPTICSCKIFYYWSDWGYDWGVGSDSNKRICKKFTSGAGTKKCNQGCALNGQTLWEGYVDDRTTCTPTNGGVETCDAIDNNCTNGVDEGNTCSPGHTCSGSGICTGGTSCVGGTCQYPTSVTAKWYNLVGEEIPIERGADIGDTVLLAVGGTGAGNGDTINYTVIRPSLQTTNLGSFLWENLVKVLDHGVTNYTLPSETGNYTFNASDITDNAFDVSSNLTVGDADNYFPIANLTVPNVGYYRFANGTSINFTQGSYDKDDKLKIIWKFGNGQNQTFYNYVSALNSTAADTSHTYASPGVYWVELNASEMTRGQSSSEFVRVIILKTGVNVIPVISEPERGQAYGAEWIQFNASQSYVVNCSTTMSPFNFITNDSILKCLYLHAPETYIGQNLPGYNLTLNWSMGDGTYKTGMWTSALSGYYSIVDFKYRYATTGRHDVNLRLTYSTP